MGLGSGIRKKPIPDPGTGSIPYPDPQPCCTEIEVIVSGVVEPEPILFSLAEPCSQILFTIMNRN